MRVVAESEGLSVRVVEKFLWWPKRLMVPGDSGAKSWRTRWLSTARVVQSKDGAEWVDDCFVEDVLGGWKRNGPVHLMFGLSYASWLCWPRVLMQEMPLEWQIRFVDLATEFRGAFDWIPDDVTMYVQFRKVEGGSFVRVPRGLCHYRHPDSEFVDSLRRKQ